LPGLCVCLIVYILKLVSFLGKCYNFIMMTSINITMELFVETWNMYICLRLQVTMSLNIVEQQPGTSTTTLPLRVCRSWVFCRMHPMLICMAYINLTTWLGWFMYYYFFVDSIYVSCFNARGANIFTLSVDKPLW